MLALVQNPVTLELDVAYDASGMLVEDQDLETAILCSLFWDAPAKSDDVVPVGVFRRGFWADAYSKEKDVTGSRLWLLERDKVTPTSILDAKLYTEEALAWMLRDEVASAVIVTSSRLVLSPETQGIRVGVLVVKPDGSRWERAWNVLTGKVVS